MEPKVYSFFPFFPNRQLSAFFHRHIHDDQMEKKHMTKKMRNQVLKYERRTHLPWITRDLISVLIDPGDQTDNLMCLMTKLEGSI